MKANNRVIRPLWHLKYNEKSEYQTLYQYLLIIKEWRNKEAHISPTASEQEIDAAINIIITMYFFATGPCITELDSNGHDVEGADDVIPYQQPEDNSSSYAQAAEEIHFD